MSFLFPVQLADDFFPGQPADEFFFPRQLAGEFFPIQPVEFLGGGQPTG